MRELEARNTVKRKKLMQAICQYLSQSGVKARLVQESALDLSGIANTETAIQLQEQRIDAIYLTHMSNIGCGENGEMLRFQYRIKMKKPLPPAIIPGLRARTKTVKTGKVLGLFGGKIAAVKWNGQELADILNRDMEVSDALLNCAQIWGEMEMNISPESLSEINIAGPWFVNPDTIIALYAPGRSYPEQDCVFGYRIADKIAELIHQIIAKS